MPRKTSAADPAQLLQTATLRRTPVRIGVLELLSRSSDPLAVTDMLQRLPRGTDAVTVYRTLNTFTRKKLIHRVRGEDRTWRYALSTDQTEAPEHQHPHFVCEECGSVRCLATATVPSRFVQAMRVGADYAVRYAEVVLHGRCPQCRGHDNPES
jgi:Fur family ferric uptake transcriptional regulator